MIKIASPFRRPLFCLFLGVTLVTGGLPPLAAQEPTTNAASVVASGPPAPLAPFPDGTRWAAVGDSITHGGWYIHFIHFYYMTRFPTQTLTLFNCGWNGAAAWQCIKRYPYDVAPLHANVASIMFGMNDGGRDFYDVNAATKFQEPIPTLRARAIDSYEKNLKALVEKVAVDKTQVIVVLPSIFDDSAQMTTINFPGYDDALKQMSERARKVAQEEGLPVVDFYDTMQKINQEQQALDPKFTLIGSDRTHPGPMGHLVMTYCFLKAQSAPSDVARFSVKGTDGSVTSTSNCQIDLAKVENGKVSFRYSAKAIPFPVEHWYRKALDLVPFTKDLNQEVFQVTDLPAGNYDLQIDGKSIRPCTADELGAGVNLSEEDKTPEYQQSAKAWHVYQAQFDSYSKLRDIITNEEQIVDPALPRPLTVDQDLAAGDGYAAAHPGKPVNGRITAAIAFLKEWKPREADLHKQIDAALDQVRTMVAPEPHVVTIAPVEAGSGKG